MPLWSNIDELMDYYIPPMPGIYWIDIVRTCNLRCVMCPHSLGLDGRRAKMPIEMFRDIIDQIFGNQPLIKLYLSGEPLLHEDLFEMIDYAATHGCRTMIHTNATLLDETMTEKVLDSPLSSISFSFDGCTPEIYERLRPPAKFEQVRSNIRHYLKRRGRDGNRGPHTSIEIIRMTETNHLIYDFVGQWQDSGVDDVHITDYLTWLGMVPDRRVDEPSGSGKYSPCEAPFHHGCILSDGTVVPCCLDVNGRSPMGHLAQHCFHDIWMNNAYRRLRLQILSGDIAATPLCDHCGNTTI